jgi:hypothetical protein
VDEQSDGNDCGGCGQLCAGTCTSGRCLVALAKGLSNPWELVVDATNVYWTDFSAPAVTKVAIAGGTPTTLASTGLSHPAWFAKGSSFFIGDGDASSMEWLETLPLGGGAPSTLMQPFSETIDRVAADATYGYWTTGQGGAVVKGAAGGTPLTLVSGLSLAYGIAVDANNVYWSYDFGQNQAAVASMPLAGGTPTTLVSLKNAGAIALDATNVYWADASSGGAIGSVPIAGGPASTISSGWTDVYDLAVFGGSLYWIALVETGGSSFTSYVLSTATTGGPVTTLFTSTQEFPNALAVDASSLYWVQRDDTNTGAVMKLTPR